MSREQYPLAAHSGHWLTISKHDLLSEKDEDKEISSYCSLLLCKKLTIQMTLQKHAFEKIPLSVSCCQ